MCPWFKVILDVSYYIYFYQNQPIIRHPCKTKVFCPFFHFIKHISFSCTTLLALWYRENFDSSKTGLRLIHLKPFRFHAGSNCFMSFLYFKTICLVMHDGLSNVTPPNVSNLFTYSSKVHYNDTRFSAAGNFYIKHSRKNHMKNSFSRIGANIWNSQGHPTKT